MVSMATRIYTVFAHQIFTTSVDTNHSVDGSISPFVFICYRAQRDTGAHRNISVVRQIVPAASIHNTDAAHSLLNAVD